MSYAHLHVHDTYSLLDGYGTPEEYAKRASELGMIALAQTNHGTISGHIAHLKACKAVGIHPVFGCEFYVVDDMSRRGLTDDETKELHLRSANKAEFEKLKKEKLKGAFARDHILVIATNDMGYRNLQTLVSLSNLQGFYRKPRIDYSTLTRYHKGLFVSTACQQGLICKQILDGNLEGARLDALKLSRIFRDRFALEIMPLSSDEQTAINLGIMKISKETKTPTIATNDVHYIREEDSWAQELLLAIGTGKRIDDPSRLRFGMGELFLRSEEEMRIAFEKFHSGLDKSFVADSIALTYQLAFSWKPNPLEIRTGLPAFELPDDFSCADDYLRHLCRLGWKKRGFIELHPDIRARYGERVRYELGILSGKGFANYFLITWDLVRWAKESGITVGPARGSSAGSLVAYLLEVTDIDPLRFNLSFERFISPQRTDYPDIDVDFENLRRDEVKAYLGRKYGEDHVANVATFNKLGFRSAFRDAARVLGVPQTEVDFAIGYFREDESEDDLAIDTPTIQKFSRKYPNVLRAARALHGQLRSGGTHAAGVVVADKPLATVTAIELRSGTPVIALTKDEAEALGLVKIDLLGLHHMTILSWAIKKVNEARSADGLELIKLDSLTTSLNDPAIFAEFRAGNTNAVFQFNKPGGKRLCRETDVADFMDLAAVNALDRPGPLASGGTDAYIKRKRGAAVEFVHSVYSEITKETHGTLIYQEQVMRLCRELAHLDWGDVHAIRKAIAKSHGAEALEIFWQKFRNGAVGSGTCGEITARTVWDQIVTWGGYGFPKAHAVAYAAIGYACMWLKVYYPAQYLCAVMRYGTKPREAVLEARRRGVSVKEPDINRSECGYSLHDGVIYAGLEAVKGIGEEAAKAIVLARGDKPFTDYADFRNRVEKRKANRGVVKVLIQVGAFASLHPNTQALLEYHERISGSKKLDLFGEEGLPAEVNKKIRGKSEFASRKVELLPFTPEHHPGLEFGDVLKRLDKVYPKRSQIIELCTAGRKFVRNEIRTITAIMTKFDVKRGDRGSRGKTGLAWLEDESGEIVIRLDPGKFALELDRFSGCGNRSIVTVAAPFSEYRADAREIADLDEFRKGLADEALLTDSMTNLLDAPGRAVIGVRTPESRPLKRATRVRSPIVTGLATRIWSRDTRIGEMGFMDLADETDQQVVLIWPESWKTLQDELHEGKIYEAHLGVLKDKTLNCDLMRGHGFRDVTPEE